MSEVVYFAMYLWAIIISILCVCLGLLFIFSYQIYGPSDAPHPEFLENILEILAFIGDTFKYVLAIVIYILTLLMVLLYAVFFIFITAKIFKQVVYWI